MVESVGRYKILEALGRGTMGDLYRARDTSLGRTVAIRIVAPAITGDPDKKERFLDKARKVVALSHPNIAALYEVGEDDGTIYLAGEFVTGQPLKSLLGGQRLNPRRALDIGIQIADALADAHAAELVHGDLHVGSVVVTSKGTAKILDFGLAEWTSRRAGAAAIGSDTPDDVLALGLMLFVMLTGRLPANVRTLTAIDASLPRELDSVVLKASARNPQDRYGSAAALAAELRSVAAILDVRSEAGLAAERALAAAGSSRRPIGWLLALLALAAIVWIVWMAARAT